MKARIRLTRPRAVLAALLATVAASAAVLPSPVAAQGDTAVVVANTKDDSTKYRFRLSIRRGVGGVGGIGKAAVAVSSCESGQTVAISLQGVLVMGEPSVVTPTNR